MDTMYMYFAHSISIQMTPYMYCVLSCAPLLEFGSDTGLSYTFISSNEYLTNKAGTGKNCQVSCVAQGNQYTEGQASASHFVHYQHYINFTLQCVLWYVFSMNLLSSVYLKKQPTEDILIGDGWQRRRKKTILQLLMTKKMTLLKETYL